VHGAHHLPAAGGLTGRMLIPVVQGRLEKKLTEDLERLREVLAG